MPRPEDDLPWPRRRFSFSRTLGLVAVAALCVWGWIILIRAALSLFRGDA